MSEDLKTGLEGGARRSVFSLSLVAICLAAVVGLALADATTISDAKNDVVGKYRRSFDVVLASAVHEGPNLRHRVVARSAPKRRTVLMAINTKGGDASKPEFVVTRDGVFKTRNGSVPEGAKPVGRANVKRAAKKGVSIVITRKSIGKPDSYGWRIGFFNGASFDSAPDPSSDYAIHVLK